MSAVDWGLVGLLLALMGLIAWLSARGRAGSREFLLAGRSVPWWAACLSLTATEVSAVTLLALPAVAFQDNWNHAQLFIGSAAARLVIALVVLPALCAGRPATAYEYLRARFGPATQRAAGLMFAAARLLASGVRLAAACAAVAVLSGWEPRHALAFFTVGAALYIGYGGLRAVVWTGLLQVFVFAAAGLASAAFIIGQLDGGAATALRVAGEAGRLRLWSWDPAMGPAMVGAFFVSLAAFGADHEFVQKLLATESPRESRRALLASIGASLGLLLLFLAVGTALFVYYHENPALALPERVDQVYPHFAVTIMPELLRGLVLGALILAAIDSPLASLSAVLALDFYRSLRPKAPDARVLLVARAGTAGFALALAAVAGALMSRPEAPGWAWKAAAAGYGPLLGVFLLGLASRLKTDRANAAGMLAGGALTAWLVALSESGRLALDWAWLVAVGAGATMLASGLLSGWLDPKRPSPIYENA